MFNHIVTDLGFTGKPQIYDFEGRTFNLNYLGNLGSDKPEVVFANICEKVKNCDICIVQSMPALGTFRNLDIVFYHAMRGHMNPQTLGMHEAYIAMHYAACAMHNKPFLLYNFDPFYHANFNQKVQFGFSIDMGQTYLPLLEQALKFIDYKVFDKPKDYKFVYSAKLYPRQLLACGSTFARNKMHKELIAQADPSNSRVTVEFDDAMHSIGEAIQFDEAKYLDLISKSEFTLVPPNVSCQTVSIKRAVDALLNGCCPVLYDFAYSVVPETWHHLKRILDLKDLNDMQSNAKELVDELSQIKLDDYLDKYLSEYNLVPELNEDFLHVSTSTAGTSTTY